VGKKGREALLNKISWQDRGILRENHRDEARENAATGSSICNSGIRRSRKTKGEEAHGN